MQTACLKCGAVYDLSAYKPGQRLRCRCGQIMVKPESAPQYHVAHAFHCSNCGGGLEQGRSDCQYCGSAIDLTATRLTAYCASCLGMSKEGSRYCCECGKPLAIAVDAPEEADELCPRCSIRMRRRTVGSHRTLECPMCCGLFVSVPDLETMIRDQEKRVASDTGGTTDRPERASLAGQLMSYVKCPVCGTIMNRMNYGRTSGVVIDCCSNHGYWLDAGELEKIARWVATGGLKQKYERETQELKAERDRMASAAVAGAGLCSPVETSPSTEAAHMMGDVLGRIIIGLFFKP